MIRRRVAGGGNEAESRTMLAELLATAGRGFLPTALHYNGFATARAAEAFTEAYFTDESTPARAAAPSGTESPPHAAPAADITVEHSADGTLVHGTTRGDAAAARALKANGFRWSRNLDAWYLPRNLTHETRDQRVAALQAALGDRVEVEIPDGGRRLTAAEKDTAKRERAAHRAERMSATADKLEARAEAHRAAADRISENIPVGQPILVGHHSESRARSDAQRIRTNIATSLDAHQGAREAQAAADRAERTATGAESVVTITNRIERNEALVRKIDRELTAHETAQGIIDKVGANHPKVQAVGTDRLGLRSPDRLAQLGRMKAEALDAIAHDRVQLEAAGGVTYGKHNVSPGDIIVSRGGAYTPVLRANAKSATVPTGYSWTDTVPWSKVGKVIRAEEFTPDQVRQILEAADPSDKHRIAAFQKTLTRAEAAAAPPAAGGTQAPASESSAPPHPEVIYVPVSYHHVDFARMPDGSAHRLSYDDTNPYALHAEIHAMVGDQQIGKVHWTPGYGNATVEVDPDHRRQGIGTQLMREAIAADPSAAHRWTPVTAPGRALGHRLGLDDVEPVSAPAASAWSREEASLLEGLEVDAAARQRLSARQGLPRTSSAAPTPGVAREHQLHNTRTW
jgi:GNAT superfamily N-acetyltransferase